MHLSKNGLGFQKSEDLESVLKFMHSSVKF